jgi:tetratricopeptide (TPR) repeat protein
METRDPDELLPQDELRPANEPDPIQAALDDDSFVAGVLAELPVSAEVRAAEYGERGDALVEAGLIDRAIADYHEAASLGKTAKWRRRVADSYFAMGLPRKAFDAYKRALRLDPSDAESHFHMAEFLRTMRRTLLSIDEFREAVRLDPTRPYYALRLGEACLAVGMVDEAIAALAEATRQAPRDAYYRFRLANALVRSGALDAAIVELEAATRNAPCDDYYHALLAMAYRGAGRHEDALRVLRRAAEIRPMNRAYRYLIAEACRNVGLTTLADHFMQSAGRLDAYDTDYVSRLKRKVLASEEWRRPAWI